LRISHGEGECIRSMVDIVRTVEHIEEKTQARAMPVARTVQDCADSQPEQALMEHPGIDSSKGHQRLHRE
jgi:hypothetical protein